MKLRSYSSCSDFRLSIRYFSCNQPKLMREKRAKTKVSTAMNEKREAEEEDDDDDDDEIHQMIKIE